MADPLVKPMKAVGISPPTLTENQAGRARAIDRDRIVQELHLADNIFMLYLHRITPHDEAEIAHITLKEWVGILEHKENQLEAELKTTTEPRYKREIESEMGDIGLDIMKAKAAITDYGPDARLDMEIDPDKPRSDW